MNMSNKSGETLFGNSTAVLFNFDDVSNLDYPETIKTVPLAEVIWKVCLFVVIIFSAILGNILIIVVVAWNKRLRTTTNYYIVNLAVSDLFVTIFCSWVYLVSDLTEGFILGPFFCKFNSFAQVSSLVASILSLTLIACDRFFGVVFAMKAHIIERKARHSIILVWLCAFAIASPILVYRKFTSRQWKNHLEQFCYDAWPIEQYKTETGMLISHQPARKIYWTTLSVVLFVLPIIIMSCAYSRIIMTLWTAKTPGERVPKDVTVQTRMKRKIVLTLLLIMVVFAVCWMPLQFIILYSEYRDTSSGNLKLQDWWYEFRFFAHALAFANSSINPVIYAGFNDNFKKGFKHMFGCYKRYTSLSRLDDSSTTGVTNLSKGKIFKEESSFMLNAKSRDAWNNQIKLQNQNGKRDLNISSDDTQIASD